LRFRASSTTFSPTPPISSPPTSRPSSRRTERRGKARKGYRKSLNSFRLIHYNQAVAELLHSLSSNIWPIFLIVLFFGGSVFFHELGSLSWLPGASGVHVEVFSIGFGPPIFFWKSADGTRYQVAWLPLGGFVLLPQIADLGPLEGESEAGPDKLAPVSYSHEDARLRSGRGLQHPLRVRPGVRDLDQDRPAGDQRVDQHADRLRHTDDRPARRHEGRRAPAMEACASATSSRR
jgi:hypothetical protein